MKNNMNHLRWISMIVVFSVALITHNIILAIWGSTASIIWTLEDITPTDTKE